jgi:hypothetical protein
MFDFVSKCGTPNGPHEHRANREPVCEDCAKAAREYMREYRLRKAVQENPERELRRAVDAAKKAMERLRAVKEEYRQVTGKEV